jgi:nucleoside-diphosphate-sugar epimerase
VVFRGLRLARAVEVQGVLKVPSVLVTGAAGFIGSAALRAFTEAGWSARAAARGPRPAHAPALDWRAVGDIRSPHAWADIARGMDCVVHAAARVHIHRELAANPRAAFHEVNVAATRRLALEAAGAGVKRFIFVSSIGVNGVRTRAHGFTEADAPQPHNAYARSKLEAENALFEVARETDMEIVVLRPPLVYGYGAPGNFRRLANWIRRGWPLPFGAVCNNRRSVLYLGNLTDAMLRCATHAAAGNKVFLIADREPVSTTQLIRAMAVAMRRPARLWKIRMPKPLLDRAADASAALRQLLDSLVIDTTRIRDELDWAPPFTLEQGLGKTFVQKQG